MSAPPPKSPEVSEDDHATASTADAEQSLEPDKVSSTVAPRPKSPDADTCRLKSQKLSHPPRYLLLNPGIRSGSTLIPV